MGTTGETPQEREASSERGDLTLTYSGKRALAPYITTRCQQLSGKTIREALTTFRCIGDKGEERNYTLTDLRYDLGSGRLVAEKKLERRLQGKQRRPLSAVVQFAQRGT